MPAKVTDPVWYRALAGDGPYKAIVTAVREDGTIDIQCSFPGTASVTNLTKITYSDENGQAQCWPRKWS